MKKIFLEKINMSWKNLIFFSIIIAIYTALMAMIPLTKNTSFRDIAIDFGWWILFGIIIILNSKSPKEAASKCFIFFLISQPLIYLLQVPFNDKGFKLFEYYKYWFFWTILTIPMGYIGYNIKKKNIISLIILLPILIILSAESVEYFNSVINNFPFHILSFIVDLTLIFGIIFYFFKKKSFKFIAIIFVLLFSVMYFFNKNENKQINYVNYLSLEEYNIILDKNNEILSYTKTNFGEVSIIEINDEYFLKLIGIVDKKYTFTLIDDGYEHVFEYCYTNNEGMNIKKIN